MDQKTEPTPLFSQEDYRLGMCLPDEVSRPWEDRWSIRDHIDGLCQIGQIGKPKQPAEDDQPEEPSEFVYDRERARYDANPDGYKLVTPAGVVTKLMEIDERRRAEKIEQGNSRLSVPEPSDHQGWMALLRQLASSATSVPADKQCTPLLLLQLIVSGALSSDLLKKVLIEKNPRLAERHRITVTG